MLNFRSFKILILILFLFSLSNIFSQYRAGQRNYNEVPDNSFKVELRIPPSSILDKYKNDPAFNYNLNPEEPQNLIEKFWRWLNDLINSVRNSEVYSKAIDYLLYGLIAAAIIIIIIGLIKSDIRGLFYGNKNQQVTAVEYEEDIRQMNFDELISKAMADKNYKLVIRYLYLKTLKTLSDNGLIELNVYKTNREYSSEIKNPVVADTFNEATRRFEWIWYGSFPIDENVFSDSEKVFTQFLSEIKSQ